MGITLAIFISWGTTPVLKDKFIICVIGCRIFVIVFFNNFVDISSWPWLNLDFNLFAMAYTSDCSTDSMNMLWIMDSGMKSWKVFIRVGNILTVFLTNFRKIIIKTFGYLCSVSYERFVYSKWGGIARFIINFTNGLSHNRPCFLYIVFIFVKCIMKIWYLYVSY